MANPKCQYLRIWGWDSAINYVSPELSTLPLTSKTTGKLQDFYLDFTIKHNACNKAQLSWVTCVDVLVVLPVLTVLAGLWVHCCMRLSWVLRCSWWCRVLDLRLWMSSTLRGNDPRGCKELVNGGAQVGHLGGIQWPVVELSLPHALLQTWQTDRGDKLGLWSLWSFCPTRTQMCHICHIIFHISN